jgi:hypothetical protein
MTCWVSWSRCPRPHPCWYWPVEEENNHCLLYNFQETHYFSLSIYWGPWGRIFNHCSNQSNFSYCYLLLWTIYDMNQRSYLKCEVWKTKDQMCKNQILSWIFAKFGQSSLVIINTPLPPFQYLRKTDDF